MCLAWLGDLGCRTPTVGQGFNAGNVWVWREVHGKQIEGAPANGSASAASWQHTPADAGRVTALVGAGFRAFIIQSEMRFDAARGFSDLIDDAEFDFLRLVGNGLGIGVVQIAVAFVNGDADDGALEFAEEGILL